MNGPDAVWTLQPQDHAPHPLHDAARDWPETNCYVDVWIELLHALGLCAEASLPFTIASDFEGDQWTFFKPPAADLARLFGIRIEELTLWRALPDHVATQLARRRLPLVEVDSWYLPDTAGSDYRCRHTKTTVAISWIDPQARRLRYFHNRGLHALAGDDFDGLFRCATPGPEGRLPPYCEIVKLDALVSPDPGALRERSLALARRHFAERPRVNPVCAYQERFPEHLTLVDGIDAYHAYGFASLRQLGAGYELLAAWLRWLDEGRPGPGAAAAAAFSELSRAAKVLLLKTARTVAGGRAADPTERFAEMAVAWQRGMDRLAERLGP